MAKVIKNEQIKARDVIVYGLDEQLIDEMPTSQALQLAKQLNADLVVTNSMQSPPRTQLVAKGLANQVIHKQSAKESDVSIKTKEIRLSPHIEEHDLDTKIEQIKKLINSRHHVLLVIKIQGKEAAKGKLLAEDILAALSAEAKPLSKLQISGKQIQVTLVKK